MSSDFMEAVNGIFTRMGMVFSRVFAHVDRAEVGSNERLSTE